MKKQKIKAVRKIVSLLLVAVMLFTMQGFPVWAENAGETENAAEAVEQTRETRGMPADPVHNCTKKNDGTDTTTWSYVYFGSYPQTEVTGDALTAAIIGAFYDTNGDAWVNGQKYRRISKSDTNYDGYFGESEYRYFKWERIKWRVLKVNSSTMFVVADKGLDCKCYNDTYKSITWENCTLRSWLNNDFYETAFSSGERGAIVSQTMVNEDNPYYNTEGGNDTTDRVFLLSISEVTNLEYGFCEYRDVFSESRSMRLSDYAHSRGAFITHDGDYDYTEDFYTRGDSWWWLRIPGNSSGYASQIDHLESVNLYGNKVNDSQNAVVPALHIDLSSDLWSETKSVIQGQINHQLSGYGGGSLGTSREEEVRCAFQSFASAIDAYMDVLNEAVKTEANTKEEVASLREKDQKKSQPALTGFCDDDGALNAAYTGLAEFYNELCDDCPGLKKIDLSKSIIEIEAQIVNEIKESFKTYDFSISSGDFNVNVYAYSQWQAFSGSITVTRKKQVTGKTNSYSFMLSSDLDTTKNTMAQYYKVLSDAAEQVVKDGLKAYIKDVAKLAYITQIAQDEFESYIGGIVDYMKSKGYGNLLKYAVSLYDGYNIAKSISSLTNKKRLTEALTDAESLYNQIKDLDFSDGSVKNKTAAAALKLVKEKKENLEDILYNYIYHPEKDLNANVNWFEKVWNSWFNGGKKATVQCPVTLAVFDEKGSQIGYAEDGYCEFDDSIYMEVSDDVKTVYIPQSLNVSINFIGTNDGTMNYTLEEFENGLPTGRMNYYDVSLTNGGEYTQTIPSGAMQTSIEALPLNANDGTQVNADEYISVEDSAVCEIDCEVNSGGTVYGIGDYARGDAVTLVAYPADGYQFDGWYDGDLLVEVANTYRMTALNDVTVKALFKPILKKQTISCEKTFEKYVSDKAFSLNASTNGDGKLYYHSEDESIATVSPDGIVTVKKEGTVEIFVAASRTDSYEDAVEIITIKCLPKSESSYTVTYLANGGTGAPATQEKTQGTVLTLSTVKPTRAGYTFLGWATSKTAAAVEYMAGASFDRDQNTTLYAVWKANTYTITFNKNGGSGSLSKVSCTYGKSTDLPANKFTRSGHKFLGWNTKKDGSGTGYANKASVKNLASTNGKTVTLYAQWGKGVTVTYNANSGKVSKKLKKVYHKSTYGTLATPTRKGYAFTGWYTKKNSGSKITSKTKVSKKSNHTLYAHWTNKKNKITYYLNGGKNNAKNPSGYYETTAAITLKNPTKTGYTFKGWYSDSKFKKKVTKIKKGSTGARKFYAKWVANTYTVRYNSNGGTGSMADTTSMKYGTSYKLRTNTFKRSGYIFAGWAAAPDGKVVYSDGASVMNLASDNGAVKTLYAKWTLIAVEKITLNAASVSINVGETYKLQAAISPAEAIDNLVWSSGNIAVATVSNGVVTGETAGMTTITVKSSNGKTESCVVTVKTPEVLPSGVTLSEKTATIDVGETVSLTATVTPGNAANKSVTWTSSNTDVATVSDGVVTGKSAGTATITASTGNGKTASCTVTVSTPEVLPSSITLSEQTVAIEVGKTVSLTATVEPGNATNKSVTWTSSNTGVATVSDGVVTGKSAGTATITASTGNGKTASCTVTVTDSVVIAESVSLNKHSLNLEKGETEQLQATIKPDNVTDNFVVWSSADVSVATVDQNGNVEAVNDGTVAITVSTANGKKATCSVTVYTSVQIRTVAELKAMEDDLDGNYKLAANIDLGTSEWTPIGKDKNMPFTGRLYGNGYQITGLSITDNSQVYSGLFGCCKGTVANLTVSGTISTDGSNGDSYRYAGGIAGFAENATIEKCTNLVEINVSNENETIGTYTYAGGIVGAADSSTNIFECKNAADITAVSPKGTRADAMAGGIVGEAFNGGKIQDCENTGIISSHASNGTKYWVSSCAGGIAGAAGLSKITDCINRGNVFAEGSISISSDYDSMVLAGGIAGHSNKSGNVSGENFADNIQATGNELITIIQQDPLVAFSID